MSGLKGPAPHPALRKSQARPQGRWGPPGHTRSSLGADGAGTSLVGPVGWRWDFRLLPGVCGASTLLGSGTEPGSGSDSAGVSGGPAEGAGVREAVRAPSRAPVSDRRSQHPDRPHLKSTSGCEVRGCRKQICGWVPKLISGRLMSRWRWNAAEAG